MYLGVTPTSAVQPGGCGAGSPYASGVLTSEDFTPSLNVNQGSRTTPPRYHALHLANGTTTESLWTIDQGQGRCRAPQALPREPLYAYDATNLTTSYTNNTVSDVNSSPGQPAGIGIKLQRAHSPNGKVLHLHRT